MPQLIVLYPQPVDAQIFDNEYVSHLNLLHEKMGIPYDLKLYTITSFLSTPNGPAAYYQMFSMPFNSMEELMATMGSEAMAAIGADAQRISTGGPLVIMIGK